uniref:Putative microvillar-like protein 5 n=1 Tax=Phlebotomus perniciosus TaxID=13204 RepID=F4MI47_PHLPE
MKFAVACILLTFCLSALAVTPRDLQQDFEEFNALIPSKKIQDVVTKYYLFDGETRNFVKYLKGAEFRKVWDQVFTYPDVKDLLHYLKDKNADATGLINSLADLLGLPHVTPDLMLGNAVMLRSLKGLFNEIVALLPLDKLQALLEDKLANSEDFKELYKRIASYDYCALEQFTANSAEVQDFLNRLNGYGVSLDGLFNDVKEFFGWNKCN